MIVFEWDDKKAAANLRKHGVSFEEAKTAFSDEHARLISDPDHSEDEDRFVLLGYGHGQTLLVVCMSLLSRCRSHHSHHFGQTRNAPRSDVY